MGNEATCTVTWGERRSEGKAQLETAELIFRGEFRLAIPFERMKSVRADRGTLAIRFPDGTATFELGPLAEKWAAKIKNPKGRIDKLGVKPGARVAVLGVADAQFLVELAARTDDVSERPRSDLDLLFLGADRRATLERLAALQGHLKPDGAIWVIRPKGSAAIAEKDVLAAGRAAGLVDVKVVAFSASHTAEKLVIPVQRRATVVKK